MAAGNSVISVLPITAHTVTCRRMRIFCRNTLTPNVIMEEVWPLLPGMQHDGGGKGTG